MCVTTRRNAKKWFGSGLGLAAAATVLGWTAVPVKAADFEEALLPPAIASDDGMPADNDQPTGDSETVTDALGTAVADCQECPTGGDCRHGRHCHACDPPYGMVNRLIDNKHACWTFRTDALLLWRDAPRDRALINTFPDGLPALNANQLESELAAGPRFSLFRTNGCGDAIEATYFRAANFTADQTLPYVTDGYTPALIALPATYDTVTANLGSALQSFELNGRMTVCPSIQLLSGFRWFQWEENLVVIGTNPGGQDLIATSCMNDLYGYQIGFDSLLLNLRWLRLEGLMKGGAYYNNARQVTDMSTVLGALSTRADTPKGAAFVGEVGLTGVLPITRNLDFRIGYLGLWLQGLAQPTNQQFAIDPTSSLITSALNTTGTAVVQGVTMGLEGRW
jgi:hypothetical protein